jgi:hypothetical protein
MKNDEYEYERNENCVNIDSVCFNFFKSRFYSLHVVPIIHYF